MKNLGNFFGVCSFCIVLVACGQQPEITPGETKPSSTIKPSPLAGETPATPTVTASATSQANRRVTPTETHPTAPATEQPPPTLSPTPKIGATPAALALEGPAVSYNGISFNIDPVLDSVVYAHDEQMQSSSGATINYTRFALAPEGWCREVGCVEVYPVEAYQEAFPDRPLPPLGAATILRAQDQPLSFQNGEGTRSIRMRGQDSFFANNEAVVYDFQGFSDDGQHYVSIIIPIDAPILLSAFDPEENTNAAALPVPTDLPSDYDQLGAIIREYNQEAERQLDLLSAEDFAPSLSVLDALVASLQTKVPSADMPRAASTFRMVAPVNAALLGEVTGLRAGPGGSLWVTTTHGYMLLRDGHWYQQPSGRVQTLVGVDDTQRIWFFLEGDGGQIYYWDGGPEFTMADSGWVPVPDPTALEGRGVLTDPLGQVWLATDQDVRVFDGERWTVFLLEDMGMTPPGGGDIYTWFTLRLVGDPGQIWVGECDWAGPGPGGGGGARFFDGQTWRGAESPVASGCVAAIQQDSRGHIWVGLDSDLWRYDPAADEWRLLPPPQAPEGYRFRYVTDITLDPSGEPWPLFPLCGGASCVVADVRYRQHDGEWIQIGEPSDQTQTLVFDGAGTPWLFRGGQVYRIEDDAPVELPGARFSVDAVTVDAAGWIWVAGAQPGGGTALWVLESEARAADALAVCPLPGEEQPPMPKVTDDKSIVDMFEPQIQGYLNTRGDAQGLQTALNRLVLTDHSGTDWQARTQVFSTDVTGDTTPEVVVDLSFFVEGQYADGALFVFRCQAGGYVGGAARHIGGQVFSAADPDPGIRAIQDMNGDGKSEIVFSYIVVIGTHANFTREFRIIEWDGSQFVDLIQGGRNRPYAAQVLNGDGVVRDADGDGLLELELTHGVGRGPEASTLDRPRTEVWAWDGVAFTPAHTQTTTTLGTRQVTVFHVTTPLPAPTPATAKLDPEIIEFVASPLIVNHGDPITLTWKVIAEQARISYLNNAGRLSIPISVPLRGGLVFTTSPDPRDDFNLAFYLFASSGVVASQAEVAIEFVCPNGWFFPNPPEACPLPPTQYPNMIAQRFEHGVMVQDEAYESRILVLRQSGEVSYIDNTWSPGLPESDPNIIPPPAYYQPTLSFGTAWREHPAIREQLGWAIDEEFALDGMLQCDTHPEYTKCYMTGPDNQIYVLDMFGLTWFVWTDQ